MRSIILAACLLTTVQLQSQVNSSNVDSAGAQGDANQFIATHAFLDAAINSINAFSALCKKESYRNKTASFNNPTSSDMGFSLEQEIQTALKPLLAKAKTTNAQKFTQVVASLVAAPTRTATTASRMAAPLTSPIFTTLLSLVGNLTIQEKKITREDLDTFINTTSKYFLQYEKLHRANLLFDQQMDDLNQKLAELQFDLRNYLLDLLLIYHGRPDEAWKKMSNEAIFLQYLDPSQSVRLLSAATFHYPSDGIKNAKDFTYTLQKLFAEYGRIFTDNYTQIRSILSESRTLGKGINLRQVEASLKELESLYNESRNADLLSLRFQTLNERLRQLAATEQMALK